MLEFLMVLAALGQPKRPPNWLEEIAVLDARIEVLEKRRALDELVRQAEDERGARLPKVVAVSGFGADRRATLAFVGGRVGRHRVGDEVLPGVSLEAIAPQGVLVSGPRGLPKRWLEFAPFEPSFRPEAGTLGSPVPAAQTGAGRVP